MQAVSFQRGSLSFRWRPVESVGFQPASPMLAEPRRSSAFLAQGDPDGGSVFDEPFISVVTSGAAALVAGLAIPKVEGAWKYVGWGVLITSGLRALDGLKNV